MNNKINILFLLAGEGSRFKESGYIFPKPIIKVGDTSMIQFVYNNINLDANCIFVVRQEDCDNFKIDEHILDFCPDAKIIKQPKKLDGASKSALLSTDFIDNDSPLLIVNSDQYIKWDSRKTIRHFLNSGVDGAILTFQNNSEKWSYAKTDHNGIVKLVAEKNAISNHATCGIYYWKEGKSFVKYANSMIEKNIRVNNEFYVCPVYNEAIQDDNLIIIKDVDSMQGLGTPEDLEYFLENYKKITGDSDVI